MWSKKLKLQHKYSLLIWLTILLQVNEVFKVLEVCMLITITKNNIILLSFIYKKNPKKTQKQQQKTWFNWVHDKEALH